jgi:hypothetical protein
MMGIRNRPERLALAVASTLGGLVLAWSPAARACDMKAVDDELAREAAAPAPQLHAAADPSPSSNPSPSDDSASKPASAQNAEPAESGSGANGGMGSAAAQSGGKPAAPMGHTAGAEQPK